jgi:hypothetical protein
MTADQSRGRGNDMRKTWRAQAEGWKSCCASGSKGSARTTPSGPAACDKAPE